MICFCFIISIVFSQEKDFEEWYSQEVQYYKKIKDLAEYIHNKGKTDISTDTLFKRYIYSENGGLLNDSLKEGTIYEMYSFDTLFSLIPRKLDSIGLENLDAKPLRFYKEHEIYRPFKRALAKMAPDVMVYFRKENPSMPLGTLLFDPKSYKLKSWILISQGGSGWYYILMP